MLRLDIKQPLKGLEYSTAKPINSWGSQARTNNRRKEN